MAEHTLHEPGPGALVIPGPDGEPLLTIRGDGEWIVADAPDAASQAAKAFVEWVSTYRPDAAIARVRALHAEVPTFSSKFGYSGREEDREIVTGCAVCLTWFPCPTIEALDGDDGAGT